MGSALLSAGSDTVKERVTAFPPRQAVPPVPEMVSAEIVGSTLVTVMVSLSVPVPPSSSVTSSDTT